MGFARIVSVDELVRRAVADVDGAWDDGVVRHGGGSGRKRSEQRSAVVVAVEKETRIFPAKRVHVNKIRERPLLMIEGFSLDDNRDNVVPIREFRSSARVSSG